MGQSTSIHKRKVKDGYVYEYDIHAEEIENGWLVTKNVHKFRDWESMTPEERHEMEERPMEAEHSCKKKYFKNNPLDEEKLWEKVKF